MSSALAEAADPSWARSGDGWDLFLFSDGAPTWGLADPNELVAAATGGGRGRVGAIFGYTTGLAGTDRRVLEAVTRDTGGALFAVNGPADVAAAAVAHRARPWRIESVAVDGGHDVLLRGRPRSVYPGQVLRVVGRGTPHAGRRDHARARAGGDAPIAERADRANARHAARRAGLRRGRDGDARRARALHRPGRSRLRHALPRDGAGLLAPDARDRGGLPPAGHSPSRGRRGRERRLAGGRRRERARSTRRDECGSGRLDPRPARAARGRRCVGSGGRGPDAGGTVRRGRATASFVRARRTARAEPGLRVARRTAHRPRSPRLRSARTRAPAKRGGPRPSRVGSRRTS